MTLHVITSVSQIILREREDENIKHLQQRGDQERAQILCWLQLQDNPLHTTSMGIFSSLRSKTIEFNTKYEYSGKLLGI